MNKERNSRHLTSAEAKQYIQENGGYIRKVEGIAYKVLYDADNTPKCYIDVPTRPRSKPMTRREACAMIRKRLAAERQKKAEAAVAEKAAMAENRKKLLSPESLQALADATRKQPGFGCPQWHAGRWVWLSPHGDSRTRCGSPIPPPDEVLPHQRLLWAKCQNCGTRRPWGGCSGKGLRGRHSVWQ